MNYRSPLARARGLGSAKQGASEWWRQRITALLLIPLTVWFAPAIAVLPGASYEVVRQWIASPLNGVLLLAFIVVAAHHSILGLKTVIEDYVHGGGVKLASLLFMKLGFLLLALAALYATLGILFVR
jgi:succinate dehydrogenase / fumarate reductase membrane anchor subunit